MLAYASNPSKTGETTRIAFYQYPSRLLQRVQRRMIEASARFLHHIGYDNAPFKVEFYWNEAQDSIHLLQVNTRISKSHAPLFQSVDGASHHQVMLEVALGRRPAFPHRQGRYKKAAKFMWRSPTMRWCARSQRPSACGSSARTRTPSRSSLT
jgi:biotin carboxylase